MFYNEKAMKIILPYYGEFGFFIRRYVLWVNNKFVDEDIMVCCKKGQECLFPGVSKFFYEWCDADDKLKGKGEALIRYRDEKLVSLLSDKYNGCELILGSFPPLFNYTNVPTVNVKDLSDKYPKVDVLLGTRKRQLGSGKNYKHWQSVVNFLKEKDLSVGIIGTMGTTFIPDNVDVISYEISNTTECIVGMMQNSKIIINTDSGLAHLCRLLELKQTVISVVGRGGGPGQMVHFYDNKNPSNLNEVSERAFSKVNVLLDSIESFYNL